MQSPSRKLSLPPSAAAARALSSAGPVSAEEMASRRARIAAAVASAMGDSKTAERSSERSSGYGRRGREYGAGSDFEQGRGRGRGQGRGLMSVSKVLLLVLGVRQTNAVAALGLKAELEVSADRPPAMIVR